MLSTNNQKGSYLIKDKSVSDFEKQCSVTIIIGINSPNPELNKI